MRKIIAARLLDSKLTVPHYYLTVDCRMDKLLAIRTKFNADNKDKGVKLSVNDFLVKASALALRDVPQCNSSWHGDFIRRHNNVDICVAVDTGNGLITPIVTGVEKRGLVSISSTVKELADRAKINKLKPHEFQGGTFTISNLGMFGVKQFCAIINPPQSCILAVGGTEQTFEVVDKDKFDPALKMTVTLSCDHRVVDGAVGAKWLKAFRGYIEDPITMLL